MADPCSALALLLRSSFNDKRYKPLTTAELEQLHVQVSLLSCYEKRGKGAWNDWVVGKHGITIEFEAGGKRYSGTYLPQIPVEEGVSPAPTACCSSLLQSPPVLTMVAVPARSWGITKAVSTLVRKTGWRGPPNDALLQSISLTRYQSTSWTLSYGDYKQMQMGSPQQGDEC
jgi:hypothetical protein